MENQTPTPPQDTESVEQAARAQHDLVKELRELADTLEQAARQAVTRERIRELEEEVRQGFSRLRQQSDTALKQTKVSDAAQGLGSQARKVAGRAADVGPMRSLLSVLATGVAALNERLQKFLDETKQAGAEAANEAHNMAEAAETSGAQVAATLQEAGSAAVAGADADEPQDQAKGAAKRTKARAGERIEEGKAQLTDAAKTVQRESAEAADTGAEVADKLDS